MQGQSTMRAVVAAIAFVGFTTEVQAVDYLVGHSGSATSYRGTPSIGSQYKITIKAGKNGNPAALPLPADPISNGGSVTVERGGGVLADPLTAGTWTGMGTPPGSKGWKYKNSDAPTGGPVSQLSITPKSLKLTAKSTGTMPIPSAANGPIDTVISIDGVKFCTQATAPYSKEVAGKSIKSKDETSPSACPVCIVGTDSDGDRLDNCYETNTGVFVSATNAGSNPAVADTDADSIEDGDEVVGTAGGLNLPAMGTDPLHQNILLEYDWFDDDAECAQHSHRPTEAALAMVTAAFAAAPVANPDGTTGIDFIHDRGQGGAFTGGNLIRDADGVIASGVGGSQFLGYKEDNFDANRNGYFHYALLPHRYNTDSSSSGQAEVGGDDEIVSLYCANSDANVAHTILHELGHNLGLRHGGFEDCNYKPNYNSVMNYLYQFPGIDNNCTPPGNGVLSYSIGDRIDLNETSLDENLGTCGTPSWDWNENTTLETGLSFDINSDDDDQPTRCGGTLTLLQDYDDWSNLLLGGILDSDGARVGPIEIVDCTNPAP